MPALHGARAMSRNPATVADRVMGALQDPDTVGSTEYRVVFEHLVSVIDSAESDADLLELLKGSLLELQEWTEAVRVAVSVIGADC